MADQLILSLMPMAWTQQQSRRPYLGKNTGFIISRLHGFLQAQIGLARNRDRARARAIRNPSMDAPAETSPPPVGPLEQPLTFPVVGIGASAGGLAAFEAFFSGMATDAPPGMAFVLVQHLAPDHTSLLSELVGRCTRMPVFEIVDGMAVQVNCVYIIPPGRDMAFANGKLQLLEPAEPRGRRLPIDFFFRSLAQDLHERAIGIVLSGTGSDGTLGVRAIKGEGGMVMAQFAPSAEFAGMPLSAIATGLVDYELPPAEMPAQLLAYTRLAFGRSAPLDETLPPDDSALNKIFVLLRQQTGHDFSLYKPSTLHRRIERRMAVQQIAAIDDYVKYLPTNPAEVEALFRDLLIGVTRFFRDPEAFKVLQQRVIPQMFADKAPHAPLRVWTTGCSTGEEAYSIAMLLVEHMEAFKTSRTLELFATDIDPRAIATARAGVYPASIAVDLTPERLARFFTPEPDGSAYRVHKGLRDLLVFSEQDVIKDPPFSRLDLISCRNLLIYMGAELQKKLIPLFHYALQPGGFLFLGTSEGVGDFDSLFDVLDRKVKLYRRKDDLLGQRQLGLERTPLPMPRAAPERGGNRVPGAPGRTLRETTEQALLAQLVAVGALVNSGGDILYLHGRSGQYLEPSPGEAGVNNIVKMAREGLRHDLAQSLEQAASAREVVVCPGLRVKTNGHHTTVNLTVRPVFSGGGATVQAPLYLVILEEALAPAAPPPAPAEGDRPVDDSERLASDAEAHIAALKAELRNREDHLRSANEDLASSSDELKSSTEQMQSLNEELQSTNEELQTSKEELQSVNEELATVNAELQTKVADLSRANNDMKNLLAGTGIGTVFVDRQLRVLRFTPAACDIINLIPTDLGRPLAHLATNLIGQDQLVTDLKAVLATLQGRKLEVQITDGRRFALSIQPYRTLDNVIEGAVMTFADITEIVRLREEMRRLAVVVRDSSDAVTVQDLQGRTLAWNPGAVRLYGWTEAEALAMNARDRIPEPLREAALSTLVRLSRAEVLEPDLTQRLDRQGRVLSVSIVSSALIDEAGQVYAIATTERATNEGHA